ncbi:MAG: TolC family outer membrane protein [Sphingopyxis sp.]|nr:TolC family outer membrane protein [Sphingopyxis sp.]
MPAPTRLLLSCTTAIGLLGVTAPASAETLREALAAAYESNPTLAAARAGQRAVDETVPIARADGLPTVGVQSSYSEVLIQPSNNIFAPQRSASAQGQISVPLYRGGAVRNAVRASETRVESGQARLRGAESAIFSQVVGVYMDVLRDEAVVALNRNNVDVLSVNLEATRDRFDIGDLTRTDVAQSEARLALARGQLQAAESRLIGSRENYIRLVGRPPENLVAPPGLPSLPTSAEAAVEITLAENPDLEAANIDAVASGFDVRAARGARMPQVDLTTNGSYTNFLGTLGSSIPGASAAQTQTSANAGVSVTIPLFQGGRPAARVRQAQARQSQSLEEVIATERSVIAQTRAAYASWQAANAVSESSVIAVNASRLSLEGVRAENSVGTRTILDILNAEQELLNAQVQLVTARRDAYVAAFTLIASMGRAEAQDIGIGETALYDPALNAERVRGILWDWDTDPAPQPVSTRTIATPPQTATVSTQGVPVLAQ